MLQNYGETLRKRRKIRGITLIELAERTGVSQADLVGVETGQMLLTEDQRQKIDEFIFIER